MEAEGELLAGNPSQAIAKTREAIAMTPHTMHIGYDLQSQATAAAIFAWAGASDEAVVLLENLSKGFPGLGPAEITRDPLYSIPLANNARYKILERKLEAEIAVNQQLF